MGNKVKIETAIGFFNFLKKSQKRKQWLQSMFRIWWRNEKDKSNVNNALILEFHFDPSAINVSMGQGEKTSRRNVVSTFEDMKKTVS